MVRYALEMGVRPLLATNYGWFVVAEGDAAFDSFPRQQVSIFNVDCQSLASEMLRWNAYPYRQFWQGTLNEAFGNEFLLKADGHYLVYRTYKPKV
jgi:thiamine pyrophosphokinase